MKVNTYYEKIKIHVNRLYIEFFKILTYCLPIQANKIVFINYHGKGYGDNLKYIANQLIDKENIELVWLVRKDLDITKMNLPEQIRISYYDTPSGIYEMSTSKVWVANCRKIFCSYKKKKQYYVQTWHGGIALKRVEGDVFEELDWRYRKAAKRDTRYADLMISNSRFCTEMYRRAFWYNGEIMECGSPRNDVLVNGSIEREGIYERIGIRTRAKIILYVPTFRNSREDDPYIHDFKTIVKSFEKLEERRVNNTEFVVLLRLHPNMSECIFSFSGENVINVSSYPDVQELLSIADYVISDYSSTAVEFAITKKPAFMLMNDYDSYVKERGFSFPLAQLPFPRAYSMEELCEEIEKFSYDNYEKELEKFFEAMGLYETGEAAKNVADRIRKVIQSN